VLNLELECLRNLQATKEKEDPSPGAENVVFKGKLEVRTMLIHTWR